MIIPVGCMTFGRLLESVTCTILYEEVGEICYHSAQFCYDHILCNHTVYGSTTIAIGIGSSIMLVI